MLIDSSQSTLLIIDVQDKLFSKIENHKEILAVIEKITSAFHIMDLPIVYSEQYPNGLGSTIKSLKEKLLDIKSTRIEKTTFSCFANNNKVLLEKNLIKGKQVILCGIETHICVLQTAVDLKNLGYQVFIVEDAVGSRNIKDKKQAIKRLLKCDVSLITLEMLIFELVRDSKHEHFKELSNIIK